MSLKDDYEYIARLVDNVEVVGKYKMPKLLEQDQLMPKVLYPFSKRKKVKEKSAMTIHFYQPDYRFRPLLKNLDKCIEELKKFNGVISVDCSLYRDMFPTEQIYDSFLNHAIAYYMQVKGLLVYPNVRWGSKDSFEYCFDGYPKNYILSIGTRGCCDTVEDKYFLKLGINEMLNRLNPKAVIVYGPMPKDVFDNFVGRTKFIHFEANYSETKGVVI
jgi:hypothetical protein